MNKGAASRPFVATLLLALMFGYGTWALGAALDPCAIYPKQTVYFAPVGSATASIIVGVTGKQIYICQIQVAQAGVGTVAGTPALTLSYGVQSSTPCATSTPYAGTLGLWGASKGSAVYGSGNYTIAGPVPAASPGIDVCASGFGVQSATISYVQVP